jgi:hypothetical protein
VGVVEGSLSGGLVADEDSEVLRDTEFGAIERLVKEGLALETEGAEAEPLCRVPDYAARIHGEATEGP